MISLDLEKDIYAQLIDKGYKAFYYYKDDVKQMCKYIKEIYDNAPIYQYELEDALVSTLKTKIYREEACPKKGEYYYVVSLNPLIEEGEPRYEQKKWVGSYENYRELELGLAYKTEDKASEVSNELLDITKRHGSRYCCGGVL